ncbi:RNA binding protein [Schizosaccharomyces pombe]
MSDYKSLKVAELREKLAEKGLSTAGNKAELVSRLTAATESNDENTSNNNATDLGDLAPPEDDIDWGDMENDTISTDVNKPAEPESKETSAPAAAVEIEKENESIIPKETSQAPETSTGAEEHQETTEESKQSVSNEVSSPDVAKEQEKLIQRAKRFGIPVDDEQIKKAARAARFGIQQPLASSNNKNHNQSKNAQNRSNSRSKQRNKNAPPKSAPSKRKSNILDDPIEAEKARKRAERFGVAAKN